MNPAEALQRYRDFERMAQGFAAGSAERRSLDMQRTVHYQLNRVAIDKAMREEADARFAEEEKQELADRAAREQKRDAERADAMARSPIAQSIRAQVKGV